MIPCSEEDYFYKLDNMVLSSGQYLRQLFKERWKTDGDGEDWQDNSKFITKFISGPGEQAFQKAPPFQKASLKASTSIQDWDISLLTLVLQNFGSESKCEQENGAVNELKKLRNELAHHSTRKFTQEEYNDRCETFRASLKTLGMKTEEVEKLVDRAGLTSSLKALDRVKLLYQEAGVLMKKRNFGKAIERYSDAITTPSLLPVNLGEAYENRANCYLKSVKNKAMDREHCKQALLDVQQALEMNRNSWKAHYLAAQCYRRKNDLSQAIQCYEEALRLSPAQKVVKSDLDSCKVLAGVQRSLPITPQMDIQEEFDEMNKESGKVVSEKKFIHFNTEEVGKMIKGQNHVFRGNQYFCGFKVQQNYTEAFKHYSKADKVGNLEGSFKLASCYHYGRGVKSDVMEALSIYKRVAEMDVDTPGNTTKLKRNIGVVGCQHALGVMHECGIGVKKDYAKAAVWYRRAMDNGAGEAANNLGNLYAQGHGVDFDEKMAEFCWKRGVALEGNFSVLALMKFYLYQQEPDKASEMLQLGRKMGVTSLISITNDEFQKILKKMHAQRSLSEPVVLRFEMENKLETKGLTFKQRHKRYITRNELARDNSDYIHQIVANHHNFVRCGDQVDEEDVTALQNRLALETQDLINTISKIESEGIGILDRKEYLKSPTRRAIVLQHRKNLKKGTKFNYDDNQAPELKQCAPKKIKDMKPITLHQMIPTKEKIYENRILELTIIDDPNQYCASIHLIAEDDNGDTTRLSIHNMKTDKETLENFQVGCRVGLINPYVGKGTDQTLICRLRNDNPKCIVYLDGVKSMCRFCGEENARFNCSKCNRPYCSKECQNLDWKEFGHKHICPLK